MAGEGSRFANEGYTFPKPLIDVNGKPMIQRVVENLWFEDATYIFLVRSEHLERYEGLYRTLHQITNGNMEVIEVNELTEGAACTALLASELIDDKEELLIANSDQIIEYCPQNFDVFRKMTNVDGIVFTFNDVHPKWSFVALDDYGFVKEVAEKNPISNVATCGIYYYRYGKDFVRYANQMIEKDIRVNNEFYIAPVYNEMIGEDGTLIPFYVQKMHGIGTPEDLNVYLKGRLCN